jgi:hypothetical protein
MGGVQKSADGGATWNFVGLANQDVSLLAIDPFQPNVLYGAASNEFYKSTDSGANWSPTNQGLEEIVAAHTTVNALLVDGDVLYLATSGYGVFKSSDGGATRSGFNDGLTFPDVRSLAVVRGASSTVYAVTPAGVFKILEQRMPSTPILHRGHSAGE